MDASFLLIHSPLLGPSSTRRLEHTMIDGGWTAVTADVRAAVQTGFAAIRQSVVSAAGAVDGPLILVGHSGAGAFLPALGEQLVGRLAALVFLDAVVPPERGAFQVSQALADLLDVNTEEGFLRPWIGWWPPEVIDEILPEVIDRDELSSDMPTVPTAFYADPVPVPDNWSEWPCVYLQTGDAYADQASEAARRKWPTRSIAGTHLSLFTQPAIVLTAIESLIGELDS